MSRPWVVALSAGAVVVLVIATGVVYALLRYHSYVAPSESMAPTVAAHQIIFVDHFAYRDTPPRRDDVIVFMPPILTPNAYFKRVVAVPGDRLAIRGGREILNGKPITEPYRLVRADYDLAVRDYGLWIDGARLDADAAVVPPRAEWTAADTVPPGCYVVLGDNRPNSQDSHAFGFFCPGRPVPGQPDVHPALVGRALLPSR